MAHRFYDYAFTIPALTAIASAIETDVSFPDGVVDQIELQIPPGHCGLTGLQIRQAHTSMVPFAPGTWIQGDGLVRTFPVEGLLDNGNWQLAGYNLDIYPHTFYVKFLVTEGGTVAAPILQPLPVDASGQLV